MTYRMDDTNDDFLCPEVRPMENGGSGQSFLRLPDESISIFATCSKLSFAVSLFESDIFALYSDGVFVDQVSLSVTNPPVQLLEFDGLDDSGEHDYQLVQNKTNGIVYAVMVDSDGAVNDDAQVSHRDIVFFMGDSNTQAVGILGDSGLGFAATACRASNFACANYGISAEKVADMVSRFATNIAALVRVPTHIVILAGTNDWSLGTPTDPEDFEDDCVDLLNAALAVTDATIIVLNVIYGSNAGNDATIDLYRAKWTAAVATVADARITLYDPTAWLLRSDYGDSQHMNASGHAKVGAELEDIWVP
jgi:lysophospholipase L1-like esterase